MNARLRSFPRRGLFRALPGAAALGLASLALFPGTAAASGGAYDPIHHVVDSDLNVPFLDRIGFTKHVLMLVIAGAAMLALFIPMGRRGDLVPKGFRNFFEAILLYIRDTIARPVLGDHCERHLPYLWTVFFFILFANLLGAVPFAATATANLGVTAALAAVAFVYYHGQGIREQGFIPYVVHSVAPPGVPVYMLPLMIVIEIVGHGVRPFTLAVRLFANMAGGHIVLATVYGFAILFGTWFVAPLCVGMGLFIQILELLVALIQAFVFTFLVTIFLGMSVHPEH